MSPRIVNLSNLQQFTAVNLSVDPGEIGGPVVVPQAAQITISWGLADLKTVHNVLYGRYVGLFAGTVAQANSILTALSSGAQWTALASHLSSAAQIAGVSIRDVNSANQPVIASNIGGQLGTGLATQLPSETALVVTKRTALAGRQNRGRMYLGGWASDSTIAGDVASAAVVTALQNWANTIASILSAQGYTHCLGLKARSAYTGSTGTSIPGRPAHTVDITAMLVRDNHWDSQRRRGLK